MAITTRHIVPRLYYYATPLFILLDYLGGLNIRAAILDSSPLYKNLYYGFCIACGVGIFVLPRLTPVVALFESSVSFLMIVLTIYLPYIRFVTQTDDILSADMPTVAGLNAPCIVNLILAGGIAAIGFRGSIHELEISRGRRHPG